MIENYVKKESTDNNTESTTNKRSKTSKSKSIDTAVEVNPLASYRGHTDAVNSIVFPHPNVIYSGSSDNSIRQWDGV